jgi:hypothetical protein
VGTRTTSGSRREDVEKEWIDRFAVEVRLARRRRNERLSWCGSLRKRGRYVVCIYPWCRWADDVLVAVEN